MNQHIRAGAMTAGILGICAAVGVFFQFVGQYVTAEMVPTIVSMIGIGACVVMIYSVFLSRIRDEDTVKTLVDRK